MTTSTMGHYWPAKKRGTKAHHIVKPQRGNQTSGKSKGIRALALEKYMCRHNRSYKHPLYEEVMSKIGIRKKQK